jgi:pimeloyl-ACP methyl ester carboxylesterase
MEAFSSDYRTVAMDLRGYNLSDAPEGVENYYYDNLVGDVLAVIQELGEEHAIIVAHDWGAAIAWRLATLHPDAVQRLVICSVPHPSGLSQEVQKRDAGLSYADRFIAEGAEANFPPEWLSGWVADPDVRQVYLEAFRRSDVRAMLNYYRANFRSGSDPEDAVASRNAIDWVPIRSPVLVIFGEADPYLPVDGLNNTWDFVDNDLRLDIIQDAGHFVQQDASDKVTRSIRSWLAD